MQNKIVKTIYETDDKVFREECSRLADIHGEKIKNYIRELIEIQKPLITVLQKFVNKKNEFEKYIKQNTGTISLQYAIFELSAKDEEYDKLTTEYKDLLYEMNSLR